MKVFIKNKILSIGDGSEVLKENHEPIFKVKGKVFTFTKKKRMYDMNDNLLYTIRNKYWTFFTNKAFVFNAKGEKVATIKKNKFSFNKKFEILDTFEEMSISGKFFNNTSSIMKNGEVSATIKRDFTLFKDAFTLEAKEEDIPFYTALVIALDNVIDEKQED